MNRRGRERNIASLDRRNRLAEMAEAKPDAKAVKAFARKAYECCDVAGYMAKKYDINANIDIQEENIEPEKNNT